jgi:hypothetical protein
MKFTALILPMIIIGCGLSEPKVVVYNPEGGEVTTGGTGDGSSTGGDTSGTTGTQDLGLASFEELITPIFDKSCATSGCHDNGTKIGSKNTAKGDSELNRAAMIAFLGSPCDPALLEKKFKGSHGGRDKSSDLSKATVTSWSSKDEECK